MGGGGIGGIVGAVVGGAIGSVVPGVGTAIGASVGGGLGGAAGSAIDGGGPFQILTGGAFGAIGGYYGGQLVGGMMTGGTVAATAAEAGAAEGAMGASEVASGTLAGQMAGGVATQTPTQFANLAQSYIANGLSVPIDVLEAASPAWSLSPNFMTEVAQAGTGWAGGSLAAEGAGAFGSMTLGQDLALFEQAYAAGPTLGTYGYSPTMNMAQQYAYGNIIPGSEATLQAGSQAGVENAVSALNGSTNTIGKVSNVATDLFSENTPGITYASYNDAVTTGMDMAKVAEGVKYGTMATGPADTMVANPIGQGLNLGKIGYSMATAPVPQDFDQSKEYANPWGGKGYTNPGGRSLALDRKQYPDNRQIQGYGLNVNMFAKK
jgi:hypothetical protein